MYHEPDQGRDGALETAKGAGGGERNIRTYNMRLVLDRLAKSGYVIGRQTGLELVRYRGKGFRCRPK